METNVILKYRRECDSWLCPECDTENNISLGKCTVCGCERSSTDTILKQWTEADDRPVIPPRNITKSVPTNAPIFKETEDIYSSEENKNAVIWVIVVVIAIFFLFIAITQYL